MNIRQLNHFALLAEESHFHKAAERAHLSQPALSHSIKALEEAMGVQLFDRNKKMVKLTPAGSILLKRAKRILHETQNFEYEAAAINSGDIGHLRVGLAPTFASSYGGKIISKLFCTRPNISIEVSHQRTEDMSISLKEEKLDFFICDIRQMLPDRDILIQPICDVPVGLICRNGHPAVEQAISNPVELHKYGFACVRMASSHKELLAISMRSDIENIEPVLKLECDSIPLLKEATLNSDLIWIANLMNVRNELSSGVLVELKVNFTLNSQWGIARRKDMLLLPVAETFIQLTLDVVTNHPPRSYD